jgi:hypothetical protein
VDNFTLGPVDLEPETFRMKGQRLAFDDEVLFKPRAKYM